MHYRMFLYYRVKAGVCYRHRSSRKKDEREEGKKSGAVSEAAVEMRLSVCV